MANHELRGAVAVVTGSSSGIGRAIAIELARHGADIAINYRTDRAGAEETAHLVDKAGGRAEIIQADVGDAGQVDAIFQAIDTAFGKVDILVNNAGHGGAGLPLHEATIDDWEQVLRTNLYGPFHCSREAARRMVAAGNGGHIVNITSVHEEAPTAGHAAYHVAKGGLRNLTRALAIELAEHGITVNDVAPGMTLTPMNQRALSDPSFRAYAESLVPLKRAGAPEDVARMVRVLCTADGAYCTGSTFFVDGGWMLTWPPV